MLIRRPEDIGALMRQFRRTHGLSQIQLAARLQTTQKWLSHVENGKSTAQIGLVLRALNEIGATLAVTMETEQPQARRKIGPNRSRKRAISIDGIVDG